MQTAVKQQKAYLKISTAGRWGGGVEEEEGQ